ncbi:MAG: flagellin [Chitinispirillaceae bacterium]|jgi:flagellin|nr:flagellin [Chitinispirillaceae bacterium]
MASINNNIAAMITANSLNAVNRQIKTSLERLSTGLRINRASDDAAGLSVSEQLRTQVRGLAMGARNIQDGISMINIADGCLIEVGSMIQRIRELCIEAANDTYTSQERDYLNQENMQLKAEIDRIVAGTQFNSMPLLNGTAPWGTGSGGILHIGPNNVAANDEIQYLIPSTNLAGLGLTNISMTSQTDAVSSLNVLDQAIYSVNALRANLGAITNRLEHALINQDNQSTNMTSAESIIRDADFAKESTMFARNQILTQSSTAMLAQANTLQQNVLSLLKS